VVRPVQQEGSTHSPAGREPTPASARDVRFGQQWRVKLVSELAARRNRHRL